MNHAADGKKPCSMAVKNTVIRGVVTVVKLTATFSDETYALLSAYAREKQKDASDIMREVMLKWLEDEEDIRDAEEACEEYLATGEAYSLSEVKKELGMA